MQITQVDLPLVGTARVTVFTPGVGESKPLLFHILSPPIIPADNRALGRPACCPLRETERRPVSRGDGLTVEKGG
jgi:hypothetical protein